MDKARGEQAPSNERKTETMTNPAMFGPDLSDPTENVDEAVAAEFGETLSVLKRDVEPLNPFEALEAEAKRKVENISRFDNSIRPGWSLEFDLNIEAKRLTAYQKAAKGNKKNIEDADLIRGNVMMIAETNTGIFYHGTPVEDPEEGGRLLVNSHAFVRLYGGVTNASVESALKSFLGDAQIVKLGAGMLAAAGYDEDLRPVDPING